jgi:hypothetical protein
MAAKRSPGKKTTTLGGLLLAGAIALYSFGRPVLNEQMGWNLPELPTATVVEEVGQPPAVAKANETLSKAGPLVGRVSKTDANASKTPPTTPKTNPTPAASDVNDSKLVFGLLKDLGGDRYLSPAGLLYTRGGAEGHRLDHLERHVEDDPGRPGKHGVFDGGMEKALVVIDRAYERAKTGQRTTKEIDQGRTVYTVDMGSRVGYLGGREGNRLKKPMARRVRLVLDDNRVITAFPL